MAQFTIHREMRSEPLVWAVSFLDAVAVAAFIGWVITRGFSDTALYVFIAAMALIAMLLGLLFNFFRVPFRSTQAEARDVIAPCDGKVVVIEPVMDRTLGACTQLSIFMSPLDVHVNYSPVHGTVERVDHQPGKYLVAWHPKSSTDNEQTRWIIDSAHGVRIGMKQIAGALARRIRWYVEPNQAVKAGDEVGFIKFGSRVDLLLPRTAEVQVQLGQRTVGGETRVAVL